jgi:hypothetical protein
MVASDASDSEIGSKRFLNIPPQATKTLDESTTSSSPLTGAQGCALRNPPFAPCGAFLFCGLRLGANYLWFD